jgi:hypothetical protein
VANARSPQLIPAPQIPPRPVGIFDVALGPMPFPEPSTVGNGLEYQPDTCIDDVFLYAMNCPAVSGTKTFSGIDAPISGAPFGVITSYICSSIGYLFDEAQQRVLNRMQLREQRAVERRIWQGQPIGSSVGGIAGLFQSSTTLGTASCPTVAVQMLEQALADNGVIGGILHARPAMSSHLTRSRQIERTGRSITTTLGTPVVFGQGYDGTGPQGQAVATSTEWMYASGRILLWATDAQTFPPGQTMDFASNTVYTLAEKIYVAVVECGSWAVQVTRDCTTTS